MYKKVNRGIKIFIKVIPNSNEFKLIIENYNEFRVYCKSIPYGNRLNKELITHLSRMFNVKVFLTAGYRSKNKEIFLEGMNEELLRKKLKID